jgi:hypothetical protein
LRKKKQQIERNHEREWGKETERRGRHGKLNEGNEIETLV